MPSPGALVSQGQTVALVIAAAGVALLVLALALENPVRHRCRRTRTRSVLVGALLLTAGLALLLVRRLDPAVLSRVLANVTAAAFAAAAAGRQRQGPTASGRLDSLPARRIETRRLHHSPSAPSKELS